VTTNKDIVEKGSGLFAIQKIIEIGCCFIAMYAVWPLLKDENKEIEWNNRQNNIGSDDQNYDK
jgi:hypothetical protein